MDAGLELVPKCIMKPSEGVNCHFGILKLQGSFLLRLLLSVQLSLGMRSIHERSWLSHLRSEVLHMIIAGLQQGNIFYPFLDPTPPTARPSLHRPTDRRFSSITANCEVNKVRRMTQMERNAAVSAGQSSRCRLTLKRPHIRRDIQRYKEARRIVDDLKRTVQAMKQTALGDVLLWDVTLNFGETNSEHSGARNKTSD
ncbi:hypothetical protein T12_5189 [Trichinella patagoniensis]|uniref:Uncharacterized protein n=1 Tax=Trichinella patagoniensis TaxID=990121 RepID=A0A0V0Z4K8_9BILA|nr:hypothetical protein T12_5189 [Trichinella patagoniensis]